MADKHDKHPYANANSGLTQLLDQLRKSFPASVDADLLKKLAIAPNNESYIINVIRFLGIIVDEGKRADEALKVFTLHEDTEFRAAFAEMVKKAYVDLFNIYKDETWTLSESKLIAYFRQSDQTSELIGSRQTKTFRTLAMYSGRITESDTTPRPRTAIKQAGAAPKAAKKVSATKLSNTPSQTVTPTTPQEASRNVALTVRVEVNLPAGADQDTYDKIFRSIRENLMNG